MPSGITRLSGVNRKGVATLGARGSTGRIQVFGVEEAIVKLGLVNKIARIHLGYLVHKSAEDVAERARDYVPKETHNLEHGTKAQPEGPYTWSVVSSSMLGDVAEKNSYEYAGYVEYGSSHNIPSYYLTRAYNEQLPLIDAALKLIGETLERI